MANGKRLPKTSRARGWKAAGAVRIGGVHGLVKKSPIKQFGRVRKQWRDFLTGRFVTQKQAKKLSKRPIPIKIEKHYRALGRTGMVEAGFKASYRIKLPKSLLKRKRGFIVDAVIKKMRAEGHKQLPRVGRGKKKRDQVRFFYFLEGQAYDEKQKKRIRAGTGGRWARSIESVKLEAKSKIDGLLEGKPLSHDPFKTVGSGQYTMKHGPDTIYITAVYGKNVPVPGLPQRTYDEMVRDVLKSAKK